MRTLPILSMMVIACGALAGCGASSRSVAMGTPHAPLPEQCALELVSMSELMPGGRYGASHELVGVVYVSASTGATATDAGVKKEVREKACALGGELISVGSSATQVSRIGTDVGQSLSFVVYAKRVTGSQTY